MSVTWKSLSYAAGAVGSAYVFSTTWYLPVVGAFGSAMMSATPGSRDDEISTNLKAVGTAALFAIPMLVSGYGFARFSRKFVLELRKTKVI
jgi:hypothetical protein